MATQLISEFNTWQPDYANATVSIYVGNTSILANVYTDQALQHQAANPQTLASMTDTQGQNYGKFAVPLYTNQSYRLHIAETSEETGIKNVALTTLSGQDASTATIQVSNSNQVINLRDAVSQIVFAELWGSIETGAVGSAAVNTATINTALGQIATGGSVVLPAGLININGVALAAGCVLEGQGKDATTLQSIMGDKTITLLGALSGLKNLTLDGNNLTSSSYGVYAVKRDYTIMDNVKIKRFANGIVFKGGSGARWRNFDVVNCNQNALLDGDLDAGATAAGGAFEINQWNGGLISESTNIGLQLCYVDAVCKNFDISSINFLNNLNSAVNCVGAQYGIFRNCSWDGNVVNVSIQDDTTVLTPSTQSNNQTIALRFDGGVMHGGIFQVTGTAQDVMLDRMDLRGVAFAMNTPINNAVILRDCVEDSAVTITGEGTKLLRVSTTNNGASNGLTTGNVATKAWSLALQPGQLVYIEAKIVGIGRNVAQRGIYHVVCGAYRAGSALAYDTQTANFTVGDILTGASSHATARIQADADAGATGALTLINISGNFLDNEIITDTGGGSALANGVLSPSAAALDTVGMINLRTAYETNANWAVSFVANANEIEIRVTGDTNQTVDWTVDAVVTSS